MKFYINLIFSLVTPPCKAASPGTWLGRLPELSSLSQAIQLHAPSNMSEGRLDQTIHCFSAQPYCLPMNRCPPPFVVHHPILVFIMCQLKFRLGPWMDSIVKPWSKIICDLWPKRDLWPNMKIYKDKSKSKVQVQAPVPTDPQVK